jgi:hypothetical protein
MQRLVGESDWNSIGADKCNCGVYNRKLQQHTYKKIMETIVTDTKDKCNKCNCGVYNRKLQQHTYKKIMETIVTDTKENSNLLALGDISGEYGIAFSSCFDTRLSFWEASGERFKSLTALVERCFSIWVRMLWWAWYCLEPLWGFRMSWILFRASSALALWDCGRVGACDEEESLSPSMTKWRAAVLRQRCHNEKQLCCGNDVWFRGRVPKSSPLICSGEGLRVSSRYYPRPQVGET